MKRIDKTKNVSIIYWYKIKNKTGAKNEGKS